MHIFSTPGLFRDRRMLLVLCTLLATQFIPSFARCNEETGECPNPLNGQKLGPSDLPLPKIFDGFDSETSVRVGDTELTVLQGSMAAAYGNSNTTTENSQAQRSELVVLPNLIPRDTVAEILTLLRGHENADVAGGTTTVALDSDPDSVDGMTSQEIFLDNDSLRMGQPSKSDPNENMEERRELREKLRSLTDKYAYEILTPFLEEHYGADTCGRDGRRCTACYSLIRRYRAGERQSHAPHNDAHSFVTVVVSLTDYGDEYNGGLYVSTKNSERNYVKLNRGDAVAHQSDLHHGVRVLDERDDGGPSERWSWILWFRDSDTCEDHGEEWHRECAHAGDPTCMYLYATRTDDVLEWNQKASDAGHAQASVKLAYAHLKVLPSPWPFDFEKAKALFAKAIASSNEPDGHYGMASLKLSSMRMTVMGQQPDNQRMQEAAVANFGSPLMQEVVAHLEEAAKGGHVFAMFNLGMCYTYGYNDPNGTNDYELAAQWFEASGLPEGFFVASMYLQSVGRMVEAQAFQKKAALLGYGSPWRKMARERTGSGGSSGAKLNLNWPHLRNGELPPEF